jgi:hypothetical protein
MDGYFEMKLRKSGEIARVYHIDDDGLATIWTDHNYQKNQGYGWEKVKLTALMPIDYARYQDGLSPSKTQKNKAKERLKLIDAVWETTNGTRYSHADLGYAIAEELDLMKKENMEEGQEALE